MLSTTRKKDLRTYLAAMRVMAMEIRNVGHKENYLLPTGVDDDMRFTYTSLTPAVFRLHDLIPRHLFAGPYMGGTFEADRFFLKMHYMMLSGSKKLPKWQDPYYEECKPPGCMLNPYMMKLYSVGGMLYLTYAGDPDETPMSLSCRSPLTRDEVSLLIADIERVF
jgi:hypothetical protein